MNRFDWTQLTASERATLLQRPHIQNQPELTTQVRQIIERVENDGDAALLALTEAFDGVRLSAIEVTAHERAEAEIAVPTTLRQALVEARDRLRQWHSAGSDREFEIETAPGVRCGRLVRAIPSVGLYVPAGSAPLPSTALMLGVPAQLAGCTDVVLCTPPNRQGRADPAVLVAANLCGIKRIFKLGGAQAIAAMGIGTLSVPRCDKLFGPGNSFVTAAKLQLLARAGGPAIDMPAGPSEVLIIADAGATPDWIAADLLAQAEHGPDSQGILLSDSDALIDAVVAALAQQLERLPRAEIARTSLRHSRLIKVPALDEAFSISNRYAPEHLILALRQPRAWLGRVRSAGSVFLGDYAAEALGDYCSGTNHVLPTAGAARAWSGLSLASFQTRISVQDVDICGIVGIGPCAVEIARAEGLEAHARSILHRLAGATA